MSFWAGVASGFKDAKAAKAEKDELEARRAERKEAFDYTKGRDEIGDKRYNDEQEEIRRKWQVGVDQWNKSYGLQEDEIMLKRTNTLLESGLGALLSGNNAPGDGDNSPPEKYTKGMLESGQTKFKTMFNSDLTDEERNSPFFQALSKSSSAQTLVMTFMDAQIDEGNPVTLSQVSKHFEYLGDTSEVGVEEAKKLLASVLDGTSNIKEPEKYVNALITVRNMRAAQPIIVQRSRPDNIKEIKDKFGEWRSDLEADAIRGMRREKDPAKKAIIKAAIAGLSDEAQETESLDTLTGFGFGLEAAKDYGILDHRRMLIYYEDFNNSSDSDDTVDTPVSLEDGQADLTGLTLNEKGVPVFENSEDAKAARLNGYYGPAVVAGKTGTVKKLDFEAKFGQTREQAADDSFERFEQAYAEEAEEYGNFNNNKQIAESNLSQEEQMKAMEFIKDDSDAMKEGKPVIATVADAPDDEVMAKYNANLEAIIKQVPKDATREEKIDMILGAFMNSTPDLDPRINEDDIEFLITSALDQLEMIQ